jgi:hypothetical protein
MITVVTGAPCSGKSTYVREHARSGDVIIDMDRIALALTTDDVGDHAYSAEVRRVAIETRAAAVKAAFKIAGVARANIWVIHTQPDGDALRNYRLVSARLVEVNPGFDVCMSRLAERPAANRDVVGQAIKKWFRVNE